MIVKDLLTTLVSVWVVIVVIIVSRKFIKILELAIDGQVANETLLTILGLKTIVASVTFLPAALFMSVLMVLGRMYRDQEMSAISSAGGGSATIYRSVFLLVFPLGVLASLLSLYVSPWAAEKMELIIQKDGESADVRGITAGRFSEYSQGELVFYVETIGADKVMHKVFVQHRQHGIPSIINADSAIIKDMPDGRFVVFRNGRRIQGQPGTLNYVIEAFVDYGVRMEDKVAAFAFPREAVASQVLWQSALARDVAELQRRWTVPVGMMLLSFLAVPLAQISPRGGVYGNMLVGFLIYFSYGNLASVSQSWVTTAVIPPWLGLMGVNVLLLLTGVVLLARLYGWQWLFLKITEKVAR
ncbi:MAG: LPS export ABC transporter permease LptF [Methylococcaceae bacterium]|nr:LPS export ABC transporter permease LptF [Methylococcaceae bacterium]